MRYRRMSIYLSVASSIVIFAIKFSPYRNIRSYCTYVYLFSIMRGVKRGQRQEKREGANVALEVLELGRDSRARSTRSRQTPSTRSRCGKGWWCGRGGDESGLRQREKGAAARGGRVEDGSGGAGWRIGAARISIIRGRSGAQRRGRWSSPHPEISLRDVNLVFARFPFSLSLSFSK